MAGGSFRQPLFTVTWPTGELGGMGLEDTVRLGFPHGLEAIEEPRGARGGPRRNGRAGLRTRQELHVAAHFRIDDVIDPAHTRTRIVRALPSVPAPIVRLEKRRPFR
jgi:acetyl-CoA carboxylase carboxyltransferase component